MPRRPWAWLLILSSVFPALRAQAQEPGYAPLVLRVERAADIAEIKRLQRIYGYYIDRSDWDNVVDLLTDDATAEYGLSGVYAGKKSIRGLLYGIGYGRRGLLTQQLREHTQLQPVITLSADGRTAKGRWRAVVLLGQYQHYARWQVGPYENEYRKEGGRWKISRLHWYETFTVPFKGGWKASMPMSNVADRRIPPPDRPPTFTYDVWPATYLAPLSFPHPVRDARPAALPTAATRRAPTPAQLAELERRTARLEDERDIQILQRTYGYYVDKNLWAQIAQLFTEDGTLEIGGRGVFVGRPRVQQYLEWLGKPVHGRLYDHTQMQPVVHVSPDGQTARGRWRAFVFGGDLNRTSILGDCIYENEYRKVDGRWMISRLHAYFIMYTDLEKGWGEMGWPNTRPEKSLPPDLPPTVVYDMYPGELTAPMHYENPVTGRPPYPATRSAVAPAATSASLADIARRVQQLEDAEAIETLHNAWGYYFDQRNWDDAAALFADDGTIELALRGVYVGRSRVRQSLELFGPPGPRHGEVFDHVMYQPVIHVSDDGRSAKARVREFTMEGRHGEFAHIGGGIHENEYVKQGGVWKIARQHLYTTFLADYEKGWARGALNAPGPSPALPPDRPPSFTYEAFPTYYVQPFHYPNPVTGLAPVP
jgi:hypothetical protein